MIATAHRLIGRVRLDGRLFEHLDGQGMPSPTYYTPIGLMLQNDGRWHHWMTPGEEYEISHDGAGWRVTCRIWPSDTHVYRLATLDGQLADRLPVEGHGAYTLTPGTAYRLTFDAAAYGWDLDLMVA